MVLIQKSTSLKAKKFFELSGDLIFKDPTTEMQLYVAGETIQGIC